MFSGQSQRSLEKNSEYQQLLNSIRQFIHLNAVSVKIKLIDNASPFYSAASTLN
jgi:hypothetical protein